MRKWSPIEALTDLVISERIEDELNTATVAYLRPQQVLGHSNINTPAVYLRFNDQDLQEVCKRIVLMHVKEAHYGTAK